MKKAFIFLMALALIVAFPVNASAVETTEAEVPVTLTVINTTNPISVTVPASLPVSVIDGYVITATNAKIYNNAENGSVQVTAVLVEDGAFKVGSYHNFQGEGNQIALSINGCGTEGAGKLDIDEIAFPKIAPGRGMSIDYKAKVYAEDPVVDAQAATVIFTIAAAG